VRIQGLASKILAHCARQLPKDWQRRYGYRPLLLETLVDGQRFAGTAIERPTGSRWAKRKGGAGWTAITKRMAPLTGCCSSIPSAATVEQRLREAQPPCFCEAEAKADWA